MRVIIITCAVLVLCQTSANAASPADIAAAGQVIRQTAKLMEKYANSGVVLEAPEPRADTEGKYALPYLDDGTVTAWAQKAVQAQAGSAAGKQAGKKAGNMLARKVPFGGLAAKKAKDTAGSQGAVMAVGGWDLIRSSSDRSFDNVDDTAVYLHVTHANDPGYDQALAAAFDVYPDLKGRYESAIRKAQENARKAQKKKKKSKS